MQAGDSGRAEPLIDAAMSANRSVVEGGDRSPAPHYEDTALYARRGERSAALDALERAVAAGWPDAQFTQRDPLLAALANEPRFATAIQRIERSIAEMRQRVDLTEVDAWIRSSERR